MTTLHFQAWFSVVFSISKFTNNVSLWNSPFCRLIFGYGTFQFWHNITKNKFHRGKTESASDSLDGLCSTEGWKRSAALTQLRHWDWATLRRRFAVQQRTESNDHFVEQSRVTRWSILWVLGWIILTSFYFSYVFDDRDELDFDDFLRIDGVVTRAVTRLFLIYLREHLSYR